MKIAEGFLTDERTHPLKWNPYSLQLFSARLLSHPGSLLPALPLPHRGYICAFFSIYTLDHRLKHKLPFTSLALACTAPSVWRAFLLL